MSSPLLALEGVSAGYNGFPVFTDLSLCIERGAFAAIVGPTGAGKTTLLKVILGALVPLRGRVLLKGERLGGQNRTRVGYVPQRTGTDAYFPITVEQVILM